MYGLLLSRNSVIIQLVFPYNCFVHSLLTLSINANKEATKLGIQLDLQLLLLIMYNILLLLAFYPYKGTKKNIRFFFK
jgi:hypothetical protein